MRDTALIPPMVVAAMTIFRPDLTLVLFQNTERPTRLPEDNQGEKYSSFTDKN